MPIHGGRRAGAGARGIGVRFLPQRCRIDGEGSDGRATGTSHAAAVT